MNTSTPGTWEGSIMQLFSTQQMLKPAIYTRSVGTTPGISAVSPPARMQLQLSR